VKRLGRFGCSSAAIASAIAAFLFSSGQVAAGGLSFQAVSTGGHHTCAIASDQRLFCWGNNQFGQIGDGSLTNRPSPVLVPIGPVLDVAAGEDHTCAVTSNDILCWGATYSGSHTVVSQPTPHEIAWGPPPAAPSRPPINELILSAGGGHTCLGSTNFETWCWGENSRGALGDGTTNDRPWAARVSFVEHDVFVVAAGRYHTCAGAPNNDIYCWGDNSLGQLGDGTTTTRLSPTLVANTEIDQGLSAGAQHTCVGGGLGVACWGLNSFGEVGDGTKTPRPTLTAVAGLPAGTIASAAGSLSHTCAVTRDQDGKGPLYCWGNNASGQLGNGGFASSLLPNPVTSLGATVYNVSHGGFDFSCATKIDGSLWCWGANESGQLGDGSQTNRPLPLQVTGPFVPATPASMRLLLALAFGAGGGWTLARGRRLWGTRGR
jgi:alpha-tubulin suppressor-like RCC1 family protein